MQYEPSGPFVTSLNDQVPRYNDLLTILNLEAQAAESATQQKKKSGKNENAPSKHGTNPPKHV